MRNLLPDKRAWLKVCLRGDLSGCDSRRWLPVFDGRHQSIATPRQGLDISRVASVDAQIWTRYCAIRKIECFCCALRSNTPNAVGSWVERGVSASLGTNGVHYNAAAAALANGRTGEFLNQQLRWPSVAPAITEELQRTMKNYSWTFRPQFRSPNRSFEGSGLRH